MNKKIITTDIKFKNYTYFKITANKMQTNQVASNQTLANETA